MSDNDNNPKTGTNAADGSAPDGETAASASATATAAASGEELAQVQRQRDEYFEQLQRSRAEFINYQKRAKSQADADRLYAIGSLAGDLLDGLDNLERATGALRASGASGITEGLDMVHKQLLATLAKHGVEPIAALGQPFDPNQHEALIQQPDPNHPEGTVVAELSKGYRIHERVLRPSKVAVSIKPPASEPQS
jgi:molecular chaperone GrpE